jgi:hypothetical protein
MGEHGKFKELLMLVNYLQCNPVMLDCLSVGIDEPAYKITQDCDLTFDDIYYPPYWDN